MIPPVSCPPLRDSVSYENAKACLPESLYVACLPAMQEVQCSADYHQEHETMADPEHVERLRLGVYEWNQWRYEYPEIRPDLSKANLRQAVLSDARFSGANLTMSNLRRAVLVDADLSETNLTMVDLMAANLTGANLTGADLSEAFLIGADLVGGCLHGANLSKTNLSKANLCNASLYGANLGEAHLYETNLHGANLQETIL